jgi:carbon-monoxide dehydrogenase small subunit
MPGVKLTAPPLPDRVEGLMRIKLGPIAAGFAGAARITRDEALYRGTLAGGGGDAGSGSRVRGEVRYVLSEAEAGRATRVDMEIAFALAGPLAQFSRAAIVNDLAQRLTRDFARNLAARMAGGSDAPPPAQEIRAGSLFLAVLWARLKRWLGGRPDGP